MQQPPLVKRKWPYSDSPVKAQSTEDHPNDNS